MSTVLFNNLNIYTGGALKEHASLLIENGIVTHIGDPLHDRHFDRIIDADGVLCIPGCIDLGAHIPEPGYTQKGTLASELLAASHGGITHLCSTPNTRPVADSAAVIQLMLDKAVASEGACLLPLGALTPGLEGEQIANMVTLHEAGAVALSNARQPIKDSYVLRRLMEYSATYDIPLMLSADDASLSANGHMHEGAISTQLGLAGIPDSAETIALAQILLLVEQTGARVHISQISCARSVIMLRDARKRGMSITADTCIANLKYNDQAVLGYSSMFNVQPPLRSEADRLALLEAVNNAELAISSNHRPHEIAAKKAPFSDAAVGMSALDTFVIDILQFVERGELTLDAAVKATSILPGKVVGIDTDLRVDQPANFSLIHQQSEWQLNQDSMFSRGHNHPDYGQVVKGKVIANWVEGRAIFSEI